MSRPLRIVTTGLIAQHPTLGGLSWHYLQYVVGLSRLGHDVFYVEDSGEWPYNLDGGLTGTDWIARDCTANVHHLASVMFRFGLERKWAYRFPLEDRWFGLSEGEIDTVVGSADLLLNVSGTLIDPERYRAVPTLAYIDTDPGFTQVKLALNEPGFRVRVNAHDVHFSFGERLAPPIPSTGHAWLPTRMPIVLSEWQASPVRREVFTTVMNWTSYKPLEYGGCTYGQKDLEFMRFVDLPRLVDDGLLEIALGQTQHPEWEAAAHNLSASSALKIRQHPDWSVEDLLRDAGWVVADAARVCGDLDSYRSYIQASCGEWSIAKNGYVVGQPAWFSDRSACYLAAGRPVIVQNTGVGDVLPVGEGVLTFDTPGQAAAAIDQVRVAYGRHSKAARAVAEEYFDSGAVLSHLVERAMSV